MASNKAERLDALAKELDGLEKLKVFSHDVKNASERILEALPPIEGEKNVDRKVEILLLRSRARLLCPCVSKEAERDIQAALKLKQCPVSSWINLSECYLRRSAFKEACDALDHALQLNPSSVRALCRYSQVQRNRCGEKGVTEAQKRVFLSDALEKAHKAVEIDLDDAEAWGSLSLSLLSKAVAGRACYGALRKALAAIQQATRRAPNDPDLYYNKAMIESLMGHFGEAVVDAVRAEELDGFRLKAAKRLCEQNVTILRKASYRGKILMRMMKRDLKKFQTSILATVKRRVAVNESMKTVWIDLAVVEVLNEATMQPLVILAINEECNLFTVLIYQVNHSCAKTGDIVSFPESSSQRMTMVHKIPAIAFLQIEEFSTPMTQYYPSLDSVLINEKPIPLKNQVLLQMSSRLFA